MPLKDNSMIQRTMDYVFLSGTAATLQMVVLLLKRIRRPEVGSADWPNAEAASKVAFPA